ncbi:DUF6438 domain-containing protein [Flavobacterium sp. HSC-61S13]|uniref:DUF6438 domain-containing protein n=1 Tax=Flavobacterium sp. HSC-61S13 TaxID=2910963 RepID=UPI0020A21B1B|nr:DUF6438 domain-containing protein [Flavobacterium sp. HSC-61S13]MCP1995456.1 hypothetical protein [Flavobacterium sp. HSC-61S13]
MKSKGTILVLMLILISGCDFAFTRNWTDNKLRNILVGDWELIIEEENASTDIPPPLYSRVPDGMSITLDSIDLYLGFFGEHLDTVGQRFRRKYLGSKLPYKTIQDSIFVRNPIDGNRIFKWKFVDLKHDTLHLAIGGDEVLSYKRRKVIADSSIAFDQVIYSSSGCYGSCPILDISIDNKGNVLFQGEGYVENLGFFSSKLDVETKNYIFNKFKQATVLDLQDEYFANHTDAETITTTFVKSGKIVKTVNDYGKEGPKELIWAYTTIAHIYSQIALSSIPADEPFYPKLHYFVFKKSDYSLPLEKSESFYLWTELKKSRETTQQFVPLYDLSFNPNNTYWGADPNENRVHKYTIKSITTDGKLYKFDFEEGKTITYDLGYNFIDRNFKGVNFSHLNSF